MAALERAVDVRGVERLPNKAEAFEPGKLGSKERSGRFQAIREAPTLELRMSAIGKALNTGTLDLAVYVRCEPLHQRGSIPRNEAFKAENVLS